MATDHIRYDLLAQEALLGVVRRVLADAAKNGLPGEHHFFISFDTRAEGVQMSQRLHEQNPGEMTIVLQHQFWDLTVNDEFFEVGLSFKGVPERLVIPFAAVKGFFDPSVNFGLKFETAAEAPQSTEAKTEDVSGTGAADKAAKRKNGKTGGKRDGGSNVPANAEQGEEAAKGAQGGEQPDQTPGSAEVVQLDRFRKK